MFTLLLFHFLAIKKQIGVILSSLLFSSSLLVGTAQGFPLIFYSERKIYYATILTN